jgi:predicted nucleotidyltransferase
MAIIVDINKAKDITKDRLRAERKPLLEAQDVAFQRALEKGLDTSAIVAEKQRLRDITNQVDAANTLEELKLMEIK